MTKYDAIVIGAGHNGLIASSYLAKAGKRVLVVDALSMKMVSACTRCMNFLPRELQVGS